MFEKSGWKIFGALVKDLVCQMYVCNLVNTKSNLTPPPPHLGILRFWLKTV